MGKDFARHILGGEILEKRVKIIQQSITLTVKVIDQNRRKK